MSPGKNIRDINLIRSKISLEGDPSLRIHTNEILYHSFFLENGYKNLRYADRINMARKVKYVSELDVLELYNSFRETVHAGLRGDYSHSILRSWREPIENMERVVSQSKELDLGTTMIKHMLHGGCEIILPILQSQMKNKFSFSNILLCEAFELIGLPGLILTTGNAKKIKSATSQGLENFEEIVLHELSSFSHRALSIALDPSYSSSIENLRSAKGVKFIYIRKGASWTLLGDGKKYGWKDPGFIEEHLLDPAPNKLEEHFNLDRS